VIVPDDQLTNTAALEKYVVDKLRCVQRRETGSEWEYYGVVQTALRDCLKLLFGRREKRGRRFGVDHLERMRIEGHKETGEPEFLGASRHAAQKITMTEMNTVECADGHHGA
jgi:hypothetical protein